MKKTVFLFIAIIIVVSCNSNSNQESLLKKENEILKREIEIQKREMELKHYIEKEKSKSKKIENYKKKKETGIANLIKDLSRELGETLVKIDTNGNIKYDSGTASNGRFSGNLRNVTLSLQYNKNSNCDGCPSQGILASILFKCKNNSNCLEDMGFKQNSNLISFSNKNKAEKVYNILIQIQKKL